MKHREALNLLDIDSPTEAPAAYERAKAALLERLARAVGARERLEVQRELTRLEEALAVLETPATAGGFTTPAPGGTPVPPARSTGGVSGDLSATQLADLPAESPFLTGVAGGATGAGMRLEPGRVLSRRYEVRREIGAGGMGAVYAAFDRMKGEEVALKVMLPALVAHPAAKQRFLDEAKVGAQLSHPGVVRVYDINEDPESGLLFISMELLGGESLRKRLERLKAERRTMAPAEAAELGRQLAEALAHAHERTVHRDIKPENIWVTPEGKAKVMDFGIARLTSASRMTSTGMSLGTAYYMAPEQLHGAKAADGRADQYALGVVLYECLTGRLPTGRFEAPAKVAAGVPAALSEAVMRAMSTEPEQRYADMAAFAAAAFTSSAAAAAKAAVMSRLADKGNGTSPWVKVGAGALVAAVVVSAAVPDGRIWWKKQFRSAAESSELAKLKGESDRLRAAWAGTGESWPAGAGESPDPVLAAADAAYAEVRDEAARAGYADGIAKYAKVLHEALLVKEAACQRLLKAIETRRREWEQAKSQTESEIKSGTRELTSDRESGRGSVAKQSRLEQEIKAASARVGKLETILQCAAVLEQSARMIGVQNALKLAQESLRSRGAEAAEAYAMLKAATEAVEALEADQAFIPNLFTPLAAWLEAKQETAQAVSALPAEWRVKQEQLLKEQQAAYDAARYRDCAKLAEAQVVALRALAAVAQAESAYQATTKRLTEAKWGVSTEWKAVLAKRDEGGRALAVGEWAVGKATLDTVADALTSVKEKLDNLDADVARKAAQQGDAAAQYKIGMMYENGQGVHKDYVEAVKWYSKAAQQGNVAGQNKIGLMYEDGLGVAKDDAEAVKWYRKSAAQGYAEAQSNLGYMYFNGKGVSKDYIEAMKWVQKSVDQGCAHGQNNLGYIYENGLGVPKDYTEAVKWYRKAADQGYSLGQNNLGYMYESGLGVPKDYAEAVKWYRKGAEQGHCGSQHFLGLMCYKGNGVPKDYAEAVKWFRKAAEQGDVASQIRLGYMYSEGEGVSRNYVEASTWLRIAAEQGNADAQFNLASIYSNGRLGSVDYTEAVKWFRKAAEQGNVNYQSILGFKFSRGMGVPQNFAEALNWFHKAAAQGDADSHYYIGEMYYNGWGVAQDYAEAINWFRRAANYGDVKAQGKLAEMYSKGQGVMKDSIEAERWLNKAKASQSRINEM